MIVAILRCFVFCLCLINLVPAFKKCKKVDQCSCSTDKGLISLRKLAGTDKPRFSQINCTGFTSCTASWNPCTAYSAAAASRKCHNVAACARFGGLHGTYHPIAYQSTATCELSIYGECALKYTGQEAPSGNSTSLTVTLICGSGNGIITGMDSRVTNSSCHFKTVLLSKYACPLPPNPASRPTSSRSTESSTTESSRPVTGFNLLIAFCCILFVSSLILGTLLYKKTGGRFACHLRLKVGVPCTDDRNDYTSI